MANELGINYLAVNDLFQLTDERKDIVEYRIQVQMVEIYNEQVCDLLAEDLSDTKYPLYFEYLILLYIVCSSFILKKEQTNLFYATYYTYIQSVDFLIANKLEIRSCASDDGLVLPNATMCPVKSTTDVINLMKLGEGNRVVGSTAINNRSSRSHRSIFLLLYVHIPHAVLEIIMNKILAYFPFLILFSTFYSSLQNISYSYSLLSSHTLTNKTRILQCVDCTYTWQRCIWKHTSKLPPFGGSCR